ncbi:MAG: hypothetical protein ABW128_01265 [Rhizorhabdus sp.]
MARPFPSMRVGAPSYGLEPVLRLLRSGAAAWLAVLTVLACAVLPAGLPHTASHGSAFNPANSSVALVAKGPQRRSAIERQADPDAGADRLTRSSEPVPLLPALVQPMPASSTGPAAVAGVGDYPPPRPAPPRRHRAREPPVVRGG